MIPVVIDRPAAGGRMIARVDGQIVLVGGAIPGERVTARVVRVGRGVVYAETVSVDDPSADRRPSADLACGGCLFAHIRYARQLEIKAQIIADAFRRIGRLGWTAPVRVAASPEEGYRMRARLHLRRGRLGFFREGTHEVCEARGTGQLLPATLDVLDTLAAALAPLTLFSMVEIELSENIDATERVVCVEPTQREDARSLRSLPPIEGTTGLAVASRQATGGRHQSADDGVVTVLHGSPHVTDVVVLGDVEPPLRLRRHVRSFCQGNRFLLRDLTAHVIDWIPSGGRVVDLYAGAGLFSIAAATRRGAFVTAVEGDRVSAEDLDVNASACGAAVTAVHEPVEVFTASLVERPDAVIVDPPRTGMSREALDGVIRLRAARLVYVSCDVATLARDARRLLDAGYAIDRVDGFDLFPNTPHVETVAVFSLGARPSIP
jgi:23S rRNA (uracil1939-C5)-methyltransferase